MKFLVDAQLPRRLAHEINALGGDALHTLDLAAGNRTSNAVVIEQAGAEGRVVVTKGSDLVDSFLLRGGNRQNYCLSPPETFPTANSSGCSITIGRNCSRYSCRATGWN